MKCLKYALNHYGSTQSLMSWVNTVWVLRWRVLISPGSTMWRCSAVGQCLVLHKFSSGLPILLRGDERHLFGFWASSGKPKWQVLLSWKTTKRDFLKLINKTFVHWADFFLSFFELQIFFSLHAFSSQSVYLYHMHPLLTYFFLFLLSAVACENSFVCPFMLGKRGSEFLWSNVLESSHLNISPIPCHVCVLEYKTITVWPVNISGREAPPRRSFTGRLGVCVF